MSVSYEQPDVNYDNVSTVLEIGDQRLLFDLSGYNRPQVDRAFLTHAHFDHYAGLKEVDAPISMSPETATILDQRGHLDPMGDVRTEIEVQVGDVRVRGVPAGHVPGSLAWEVEWDGGTAMITGDFSLRDVGGWPGLVPDPEIDVLFVNSTTQEQTGIEQVVRDAIERARSGCPVAIGCETTQSIPIARIISEIWGNNYPLLVGRAGQTTREIGISVPVSSRPKDAPEPGRIVICGGLSSESGQTVYDEIRHDHNSLFIDTTGIDRSRRVDDRCMVKDRPIRPHPDWDTIETYIDDVDPIHVVFRHVHEGIDLDQGWQDRFVWISMDTQSRTLWDDGWVGPPWLGDDACENIVQRWTEWSEPTPVEYPEPEFRDLSDEEIDLDLHEDPSRFRIEVGEDRTIRLPSSVDPGSIVDVQIR